MEDNGTQFFSEERTKEERKMLQKLVNSGFFTDEEFLI